MSKMRITYGVVVQFKNSEKETKSRLYLVSHEGFDNYSQRRVSLETALDMERRGQIIQVFKPTINE